MKNRIVTGLAVLLAAGATAPVEAGFISALRDRFQQDNQQEQHPQQQHPQQQQQYYQQYQHQAQSTPPPAERAGQAAPQQTPATKSKGARKLEQELHWEAVPNNLFQRYAGRWAGHFWVYSPLGKKQEVHKVSLEFTPQSDGTMAMRTYSFDLISKQWVVEETATYAVNGDTIQVTIVRPSGETSTQIGHFSDNQVFFEAQIQDGVEHFRERVDGSRLLVDGFGVYKDLKSSNGHVFIGRFKKE